LSVIEYIFEYDSDRRLLHSNL